MNPFAFFSSLKNLTPYYLFEKRKNNPKKKIRPNKIIIKTIKEE